MYFKRDLIEEIKKIYKENTDEKVVLINLASLFKIPIDASRLDNYQIVKIDFETLSLEVLDTKTTTTFISSYSPYSEVLGWASPDNENLLNYINVTSFTPFCERESIYNVDEETPILERITIHNNEYGLCFERTRPNVIRAYSRQDGTQFLIKYYKEVEDENNKRKDKRVYDLLSSIYKSNYVEKKYINFFNRLLIHDNEETWSKNRPDQFYFDMEGNITVGSKFKSERFIIEGACFEKIDKNSLIEATFNTTQQIKNYSNFDISSIGFATLYAGFNYSNKSISYHDLEITKINDKVQVHYKIEERLKQNSIRDIKFELSNLCLEDITLIEIDIIIQELQSRIDSDEFIQYVINELQRFKSKLEIKDGLVQETISTLSPELLIDKTFDEIQNLVKENRDNYFRIISKQFDSITNIESGKNVKLIKI